MSRPVLKFPKRFLWGVSTSAHQVDGGHHNNWTVWELENAKSLAAQAPYQFNDLDNWSKISAQAQSPSNYVSGRAVDHAKLYEEDFDLLVKLNFNSFRFSFEWSEIEPEEGKWSAEAIERYRKYLKAMKVRNITPVATLFHFTLPVWFSHKGGFEKSSNIKYFVRFVQKIIDEFGSDLKWIITINEPEVYAEMSYRQGDWPPQKSSKVSFFWVLNNLAVAHKRVAKVIHKSGNNIKVSIAKNSSYVYAGDDSWLSGASAGAVQWIRDDWFLNKVVKSCDFIGVNYYFSDRIYGYRTHNPNSEQSDMGWDMQPANIQHVLERLYEKYELPILIAENGLADADDEKRKWWITETVKAMNTAIKGRVKVLGYLHWSLLDNFEWDKGFWPKFGLVSVDRRTMKRTPRQSAIWFGRVIRSISKS